MTGFRSLKQRGADLSDKLGIPDISIHQPAACCDESEGLTLREQKMDSNRFMPPSDATEADRWRKLVSDAEQGGPTRKR